MHLKSDYSFEEYFLKPFDDFEFQIGFENFYLKLLLWKIQIYFEIKYRHRWHKNRAKNLLSKVTHKHIIMLKRRKGILKCNALNKFSLSLKFQYYSQKPFQILFGKLRRVKFKRQKRIRLKCKNFFKVSRPSAFFVRKTQF